MNTKIKKLLYYLIAGVVYIIGVPISILGILCETVVKWVINPVIAWLQNHLYPWKEEINKYREP